MYAHKEGFSLTEVLVSLVLIVGSTFLLLKTQAQVFVWQKKVAVVQETRALGFSLPELLVGLSLSSLLIILLMQIILSVERQYQAIYTSVHETLDMQWAYELLSNRVAHAGFTPCRSIDKLNASLIPIEVSDEKNPKLIIRGMDEMRFGPAEVVGQTHLLVKNIHLNPKYPVIISDCEHAEIHKISETQSGHQVYLKEPLLFHYGKGAYIGEWVTDSFYFKTHKQKGPGLYYKHHRSDFLMPAKNIRFSLQKKGGSIHLLTYFMTKSGRPHRLISPVKMP